MSATNKAAVIFDVGGVLITPPQLAIAEYEKEISLPRSGHDGLLYSVDYLLSIGNAGV